MMVRARGLRSAAVFAMISLLRYAGPAAAQELSDREDAETGASEPSVVEGLVVAVADGEIIVDLGRDHGLGSEALVQLYRRLEIVHPVTGDALVDRFPIGPLALAEVGNVLSIGRELRGLSRRPAVGDFAVWETQALESWPALPVTSSVDSYVVDGEDAAIERAFRSTLGASFPDRIHAWEAFLGERPESPYAPAVAGELSWLRRELDRSRAAQHEVQPTTDAVSAVRLRSDVTIPRIVTSDGPFELAVTVVEHDAVESLRVYLRRRGDPTYVEQALYRDGDFQWRVDLSGWANEPKEMDYFVEAVRTNGSLESLAGTANRPMQISVVQPERVAPPPTQRSHASALFEHVNFNSGSEVDEYLRFESQYRYRVDQPVFNAFSVGVGIFNGAGPGADSLTTEVRTVSYGFAEFELRFGDLVGAATRLLIGNSVNAKGTLDGTVGYAVRVRLGHEEGTRLVLGGALSQDIGNEAWTDFHIDVIERVPFTGSVVVTNLPAGGEVGVSLTIAAGYQFADWMAVTARTGINARTVNDYGFTGGSGVDLTW